MPLELLDPTSGDPLGQISPDGTTAVRLRNSGSGTSPAALEARERIGGVLHSDTAVAVNGWILAAVTGSSFGIATRPAVRITATSPLMLGDVPAGEYVDLEISIDRPLSSAGEAHEPVIAPSSAAQFAGRPPGLRPGIILPSACVACRPRATWSSPDVLLQVELQTPAGVRLRSLSVEVDTNDSASAALSGAELYGWRIVWDLGADDVLLVKAPKGSVATIPDAPANSLRLATGERSTSTSTVAIDAGPYAPGVVDATGAVAGGSIATINELQVVSTQDGSGLTAPFGWAALALDETAYQVQVQGPGGFDGREIVGGALVTFAAVDMLECVVPSAGRLAAIPILATYVDSGGANLEGLDTSGSWHDVCSIDAAGIATWDTAGGDVRYVAYRVTLGDGSGTATGFLQFRG